MSIARMSFKSCILKLDRATEHYKAIRQEIVTFFEPDPKNPIFEFKHESSTGNVKVRIIRPLPHRWGVIVGDCVYNLRSALDHLVSITSEKNGASEIVLKDSEFPIFLDDKRFSEAHSSGKRRGLPTKRSGYAKIVGLPKAVQILVESLQPYHRTDGPPDLHPLWLLHEISNHDKHRKVDLAHMAFENGVIMIDGLGDSRVELAMPVGAFDDGTVVASLRSLPGYNLTRQVKVNFQLTPDVAFSPKGPGKGLPIDNTLVSMNKTVNDIIIAFEPFIT